MTKPEEIVMTGCVNVYRDVTQGYAEQELVPLIKTSLERLEHEPPTLPL